MHGGIAPSSAPPPPPTARRDVRRHRPTPLTTPLLALLALAGWSWSGAIGGAHAASNITTNATTGATRTEVGNCTELRAAVAALPQRTAASADAVPRIVLTASFSLAFEWEQTGVHVEGDVVIESDLTR